MKVYSGTNWCREAARIGAIGRSMFSRSRYLDGAPYQAELDRQPAVALFRQVDVGRDEDGRALLGVDASRAGFHHEAEERLADLVRGLH